MRFVFLMIILVAAAFGCTQKSPALKEVIRIDNAWLDSVKRQSDSNWAKPYRNNYFVQTEYYLNRKDSVITQLMKDSAGTIRQINIAKYDNFRLFFAEYYANGQLMAHLPLDAVGKNHGAAKQYYESGVVKSKGSYNHGLYVGQWENFDKEGNMVSIDVYDKNGQLVNTFKK
jgi:antitoxin component YwqK of YwqJK toxin-antitoxin module